MWTAVFVLVLVSVRGAEGECGKELLDLVAMITEQYNNVAEAASKNCPERNYYGSTRGNFKSIITDDLRSDICDLTRFASEVFENCENCPGCASDDLRCNFKELDVAFILDESSSMDPPDYEKAKKFIATLIERLNVAEDEVRSSLTTFGRDVTIHFFLNEPITMDDVMNMPRSTNNGKTFTHAAFDMVREQVAIEEKGDRPGVTNAVVLFTDGKSTRTIQTQEAYDRWPTDTKFIIVGVGEEINREELETFASKPVDKYLFFVEDFNALENVLDQVLQFACEMCEPACQNGGTCVQISNTCQCPEESIGAQCQTMSMCADEK